MGAPAGEKDRINRETQHQVTLTKDFYIGVTEVTQAQYEKVMRRNPSHFQGRNIEGDSSNHPVESVTRRYSPSAAAASTMLQTMERPRLAWLGLRLP
ncbi:MAG: SUMF1/EgtB/PvdO family nonheme iron enzyme [Planctomycetota bacterium]|jgi:formylglycine-generating enzyme required for sulfatase activity